MPYCKKCREHFPNRIIIDGIRHSIDKRVYCLSCSPFNKHNTIQLSKGITHNSEGEEKTCVVCGRKYIFNRQQGYTKDTCRSCYGVKKRIDQKKWAVALKGNCCCVCGYSKCLRALDFHHVHSENKEFTIAGSCKANKNIAKELLKCVVLCRNCHAEVEAGLLIIADEMLIQSNILAEQYIIIDSQKRRKRAEKNVVTKQLRTTRKIGPSNTAWCTDCKTFLPRDRFGLDKNHWNGVRARCKACDVKRVTKYKNSHKYK